MIKVTEAAKAKLIDILMEQQSGYIRFGLQGGGCNGFQYALSIATERDADDVDYQLDDTHWVLIDPMSMMYLSDSEIDYKRDIIGESFVFNNPNQTTSCGCGMSVGFD